MKLYLYKFDQENGVMNENLSVISNKKDFYSEYNKKFVLRLNKNLLNSNIYKKYFFELKINKKHSVVYYNKMNNNQYLNANIYIK